MFVADGDSLTALNHVPYSTYLPLIPTWKKANVAVEGRQVSQMITAAPTSVDPLFTSVTGAGDIVAILGGTNDCMGGISPATIWSRLQTYAAARHAVGWKVIGMTLPSLQGFDSCRDSVNALITANWPGNFDALVDLAANNNIGPDGSWANSTYFMPDGVHPTHVTVEQIFIPLIQAQFVTLH